MIFLHIGVCWNALGWHEDALESLEQAHLMGVKALACQRLKVHNSYPMFFTSRYGATVRVPAIFASACASRNDEMRRTCSRIIEYVTTLYDKLRVEGVKPGRSFRVPLSRIDVNTTIYPKFYLFARNTVPPQKLLFYGIQQGELVRVRHDDVMLAMS